MKFPIDRIWDNGISGLWLNFSHFGFGSTKHHLENSDPSSIIMSYIEIFGDFDRIGESATGADGHGFKTQNILRAETCRFLSTTIRVES
jgi:hypothetical protein